MDEKATHYNYLIVGGGMTADAAVRGIRGLDGSGLIGLISAETVPPYNRPPLSKGLWKGKPVDKIWRRTAERSVDLRLGRRVVSLDVEARRVGDDRGAAYTYDKLLLATGGFPRRLPFDTTQVADGHDVIYYRTLQDYGRLRALVDTQQQFVVIGGGFIGSEVAAAIAMSGRDVTMIFPEELIGQRLYPRDLATFITDYYREKGVAILCETAAIGIERVGPGLRLSARDERRGEQHKLDVDGVVAGIGIIPAVELAESAGLKVDGGIVVDANLRTSHDDVFAAGDVARFYNETLGKWMRVEHEDNANTMGTLAGKAMVGEAVRYDHLPYFYSDLFDLGYEAVGELDARLETLADWQEPYRKGVVYYLQEGRVRGVLLWDVWGKTDEARRLIADLGPFTTGDLKGRIAMD